MPERRPSDAQATLRVRLKNVVEGWFVWFLVGTSVGGALFWQ